MQFFTRSPRTDEVESREEATGLNHSCRIVDSRSASALIAQLVSESRVHEAFQWFRSHERDISEFQLEVTAIPAPPFGEAMRSHWCARKLADLGYQIERDAVGNVFATECELEDASPVIAVSAHLDTVFSAIKLDVRREQHRLLGPGISDNGAGLSGLWAIACALKACGLRTEVPILLLPNVGEEGAGDLRGMRAVFADPRWRDRITNLLVLDGSGTESVVTEALGSRRFAVHITGPGGHSWSDYGLPNPIVALARVITELNSFPLPLSPKTTLSIGTIEGGTSINAIPESATMRVDVRSTDSGQIDGIEARLREAVENAVRESHCSGVRLGYNIEQIGDRPAATLRPDAPLLLAVRAADSQLGIRSRLECASTDANIPLSMGIDALAVGAGGSGSGAHTLHEWYDPAGRDLALRRALLVLLALAGLKN